MTHKKIILASVIVALLVPLFIVLLNCIPVPHSLSSTGYYQAFDIVRTVVPFAKDGGEDEARLSKVYLKETDEYGRQFFVYEQYSPMLQTSVDIYVICQHIDEPTSEKSDAFAYYYPDDCYLISAKDVSPSKELISEFYEKNDWGKPLVRDKFHQVQYVYRTNEREYEYSDKKLKSVLESHFSISTSQKITFDKLECDANGKQLVIARIHTGGGLGGGEVVMGDAYLLLYDIHAGQIVQSSKLDASMLNVGGGIVDINEFISHAKKQWMFSK